MPEVNFAAIQQLFASKASDRVAQVVTRTGEQTVGVNSFGASAATIQSTTALTGIEDAVRMRRPYGGVTNGVDRIGFVLTSDLWIEQGRALELHAGPASADWALSLRALTDPQKSGHARFAQARNVGHGDETTYFDSPRVEFEFQTGNIMPIPLALGAVQTPYGLEDFYLFMELLNQPPLIPAGPNEGKHNYAWVFYTSLMYPSLVLKGYFEEGGTTWTDSSETPTQFTWRCGFTVHHGAPDIWQSRELLEAYSLFMQGNVRSF